VAIEKAVILAGGLGKRMRRPEAGAAAVSLGTEAQALADRGLKGLIPLMGKPLLDYVVGSLMGVGVRRLCLVVAPQADELRSYARRASELTEARVTCAVQQEPRGTADALLAAEDFAAGAPFIMCNSDNLYPPGALRALAAQQGSECWLAAFDSGALVRLGNISAERVRAFAVILAAPDGRLLDIVEKPEEPERYMREGRLWLGMNLYRFSSEIFDACRAVEPHPQRGELELTSAVARLARGGEGPVRVAFSEEGVLDLTSRGDVAAAERLIERFRPEP